MARVKILVDYKPSEGWLPGQIVDITDPWELVKQGKVVLVDENDKEIEHPDILKQIRESVTSQEAIELIGRIISRHPDKDKLLGALQEAGTLSKRPDITSLPVKEVPAPIEEKSIVDTAATPEEAAAAIKRRELFAKAAKKVK